MEWKWLMFQSLKKQYQDKEQAYAYVKKHYDHLHDLSEDEVLAYFTFTTDEELIAHVKYLKDNQGEKPRSVPNQIKQSICQCVDRNGKIKTLYTTKTKAESVRIQVKNKEQLSLTIYECPSVSGWHLSKG